MDLPNGTTWFMVHHLRKGFNHPAVQVQRYAEPVLLVCALNVAFECVCTDSRHQKRNGWILLSLKGEVTYFFDLSLLKTGSFVRFHQKDVLRASSCMFEGVNIQNYHTAYKGTEVV